MMVPVRCFSCGKPVSEHFYSYVKRVEAQEDSAKVLDSLGVKRYCCRRILMTSSNYIEDLNKYQK